MKKVSALQNFLDDYIRQPNKQGSDILRAIFKLQKSYNKVCCISSITPGEGEVGVVGPEGFITNGSLPYTFNVQSSVGTNAADVISISLFVNNTLITTQAGNAFSYSYQLTPTDTPYIYYTVAILRDYSILASDIKTVTVGNVAPVWAINNHTFEAEMGQTMHIIDILNDTSTADNLVITTTGMPSFCTLTTTNVTNLANGANKAATIADITVSPTLADAGTYSFNVVGSDGVKVVNLAINLTVSATVQKRLSSRIPVNLTLAEVTTNQTITAAANANIIGTGVTAFYRYPSSAYIITTSATSGPGAIDFTLRIAASLFNKNGIIIGSVYTTGTTSPSDMMVNILTA